MLSAARLKQNWTISFLRRLVEHESPSHDAAAVREFAGFFTSAIADIARVRTIRSTGGFGPHLICEFKLPGPRRKQGQVLALGHSDTVYPKGTLQTMPFRVDGGRIWGPGVLDMKGGIAMFVAAMRLLIEADAPVTRRVLLQLNSDEEVGSLSSRTLTQKNARDSTAVLVVEPGTGTEGKAKTARKGIAHWRLSVTGRAAHAGIDFQAGANSIVELAHQISGISKWSDPERGLTVNFGVVAGGGQTNVVPESAHAEFEYRVVKLSQHERMQNRIGKLRPLDKRCMLTLEGGLNRPPMERNKAGVALFRQARQLAAELGVTLDESSTGGGSDGNFTAAVGTPTLDGIGAVGEGAHSPHESILVDRIADRTALLAKLVQSI
jgi:glutamate carboxypeptidase